MNRLRVLHIIEQLRRGGPLQALIAANKGSQTPRGIEHHIVSLKPADHHAYNQAAAAGITATSVPNWSKLQTLMAEADVVQAHFWNSPEMHAFLAGDMPPIRLLLWCHVNGLRPPHVIPKALIDRSDLVVATAPSTLDLPAFRTADPDRLALVQSTADFTRISNIKPVPHEGFYVGYIGTIDFTKLHPAYVQMCAAVDIPSIRFLLCGQGGATQEIRRQAREFGVLERLDLRDYVDDIESILAALDVFGYPLNSDSFATAELSLQEAMYAGIPPVVFANKGPNELVTDGEIGRVVRSEGEYVAALEWLYRNPAKRQLLGHNAARAVRKFKKSTQGQSDAAYARVMECPKRPRACIIVGNYYKPDGTIESQGARSFIDSLDGMGDKDFITSLTATDRPEAEAAETRIGRSSTYLNVILQYCARYSNDPHLHLWAGLMLFEKGRPALAAAEFNRCIALGCDNRRVRAHFDRCVRKMKESREALAG